MSLRPDMVREQAQAFSLNQYFSVENTQLHAPVSAMSPPLGASQSTAAAHRGANNGLNFTISAQTLGTRASTAGVATHAAAPAVASESTKSSMPPFRKEEIRSGVFRPAMCTVASTTREKSCA